MDAGPRGGPHRRGGGLRHVVGGLPATHGGADPHHGLRRHDDRRAGAIEAFEAWVDAVRSGDMDAAWEVLGSASRLALGDREHFAFLADGLRYRWASWGRIEHVAYDLETADDGSEVLVASGVAR